VSSSARPEPGAPAPGSPARAVGDARGAEPPSGEQFVLEAGGQRAVVTEVGATLRSWEVDGVEQLDGFGADELGEGFRGKALAPWPNRVRDGRYRFAGLEHQLALNELERGSALHGVVAWVNWGALRRSSDGVALRHLLHAQPGYPFSVEVEVEYRLSGEGLHATLTATNVGAAEAPFGAGFHPYLTLPGAGPDDELLTIPGRTHVPTDDERLLPVGPPVPVDGSEYDFRHPRPIGDLVLDACYGDLDRGADGVARVRLARRGGGGLTLWVDETFRYVHVFTGDPADPARRGKGVAVEPVTCAPDAFNTGEGLLALAPGASLTGRWGLTPQGGE